MSDISDVLALSMFKLISFILKCGLPDSACELSACELTALSAPNFVEVDPTQYSVTICVQILGICYISPWEKC